ncbi:MAG: agmatine deiminase family protein [Ignavibacteria bacterium]|nr:agmatine deiminase family protein [Ignavibacteria bacterium]
MKIFVIFSILLVCSLNVFAQDLPHQMTEIEKQMMKTYHSPKSILGFTTPPASPVRTMAEWEELEGVMIAWTSYTSILRQIVKFAQTECTVYIVCSDSASVKSYLQSGGVPLTNLKFIVASFNSVWCRDYGPWSVYTNNCDSLFIIDWIYNRPRPNDDLVPSVFANMQGLPLYQTTTAPYNLIHTGGNFMADGNGTGFSSKLIIDENPTQTSASIDTIMKKFMGINRYIKLETLPYDQIHHIDMHIKLLDEETLLVGQYPTGVADGPQIEANLQYILSNFKTCYGRDYKVVRVLMPPDAQGRYPSNSGDYRTYTNSSIINKTVIVPTYEAKYDTTALRIYREAMPGYNVVGIDCNQSITALGAIHCITKEVGVREPIVISHAPIRTVAGITNPFQVKSYIDSRSGINSATLWWSIDTIHGYNQVPMYPVGADTFISQIPVQSVGIKVFYYISATSNSGRTIVKPLPAPRGAWSFIVDTQAAAAVTVTSPNGGEAWAAGSIHQIRWNSTGIDSVRIDYTTDNGTQWQNISKAVLAGTGTFSWNVPAAVSAQCKIRISDSHNLALNDISDAIFSITSPCGTITMAAGWNIISVPVRPADSSVTSLFPVANSPAYSYLNGYQINPSLSPGKGYWIRMTDAASVNVCGTSAGNQVNLSAGWNLIGIFQNDVPTSSIITVPAGIINSQFYGYNGAYYIASTLQSGKGYWVRASQNGVLTIPTNRQALVERSRENSLPGITTTITLTDANSASAKLFLLNRAENTTDFDLPPLGPAGVFDSRFSSQRNAESDHEGMVVANITGAAYPVSVQCIGRSFTMRDRATSGRLLNTTVTAGRPTVITNPAITAIEILPGTVCTEYKLETNYPNPFNPSTTLSYSVASPVLVSLIVYDPLGRQVQVLVNEVKQSGKYSAVFNAANLPSGLYFCRMQAGSYTATQKMLLIK